MNAATNNAAIDTLRSMYVATKRGAALDIPAYIDALLAAAADGCDDVAVVRAFEKLGYHTRLDIVGMCGGAGARVQAAREARGWLGAIRVASLLGLSDVWAAAMTAHFGPVGTHESRVGSDGVPTVETLAQFPQIGERMAEAARVFEHACGWYDRVNVGKVPTWKHVVRFQAPRAVVAA